MNEYKAKAYVRQRDDFGPLMLKHGDTDDGLIVGFSKNYTSGLLPILEVIEKDKGIDKVAAIMMILSEKSSIFFVDISFLSTRTLHRRFSQYCKNGRVYSEIFHYRA